MVNERFNPAEVPPGQVWAVDGHAGQSGEWVGMRCDPGVPAPWALVRADDYGMDFVSDSEVVLRHGLVPSRPVTRDDLPSRADIHWKRSGESLTWWANPTPDIVLDAVVAHLNARGGLGIDCREPLERALRDRDELEASHEQLHREWTAVFIRATNAENERDELREALTAEKSQAELSGKTGESPNTSTVTRDEVEQKLGIYVRPYADDVPYVKRETAIEALLRMVSGDDPAVHVVRESELPDLELLGARNFDLANGGTKFRDATDEEIAEAEFDVASDLRYVLAVRRAIKAEQAVDPVEELARELATVAYPDVDFKNAIDVADAAAKAAYRAIAAHVIERQAKR